MKRAAMKNESGVVSILVATLLIVVVSLLALAFAQISRQDQRISLDNQLSTQAFYAAESGVNDAKQAIMSQLSSGLVAPKTSSCSLNDTPYNFNGNLGNGASYTCVLIDPTPQTLLTQVSGQPRVIPLKPTSGNLSKVTIQWPKTNPEGTVAGCPNTINDGGDRIFPNVSGWQNCAYGVLRIDLVPTNVLQRDVLMARNMTAFLVPTRTSGPAEDNYAPGQAQVIQASQCATGSQCSVTIRGLSGGSYAIRISSIYKAPGGNVSITGQNNGTPVLFKDAQAQVDVTGKAQDVLRRVKVAVPLTQSSVVPKYAIMSQDSICKRFYTADGVFYPDPNIAAQGANGNPVCTP